MINKSTYNIRIILVYATFAIVFIIKIEEEPIIAKKVRHVVME